MNLFVAVVLLGQVSASGEFSPRLGEFSPRISIADQSAPSQEAAEPPAQPSAQLSVPSSASAPSPQALAEPAPAVNVAPSLGSAPAADTPRALSGSTAAVSNENTSYAAALLENILAFDEQSQTSTRRVRLVDVVSRTADSQAQAVAIGAYWELALAIGRFRYAQEKVQLLLTVPAANDDADRALVESAIATAEAHEVAAQDELLAAQYRLIRAGGLSQDGMLPWPSDLPLVGAYRTNFESFFAQRAAPVEIRHIHHSLPGKLRLIHKSVAAVAAAETAADAMLENYKQGRCSAALLLQTIDSLERSQYAFLGAVVDYNERIAEYSLAAVGGGVAPETLVSTLIKVPSANSVLATIPQDVRQVNAVTPVLSDGNVPFRR